MPWLRKAMIVALASHCSTTHSGTGITGRSQLMSRTSLISYRLVHHRNRLPTISRPVISRNPLARSVFVGNREVGSAGQGRGKSAVGMQRVSIHQHPIEIDGFLQLAWGLDLATGIGGVGGFVDRYAQ